MAHASTVNLVDLGWSTNYFLSRQLGDMGTIDDVTEKTRKSRLMRFRDH